MHPPHTGLKLEPLHPMFGARISGVDLGTACGDQQPVRHGFANREPRIHGRTSGRGLPAPPG